MFCKLFIPLHVTYSSCQSYINIANEFCSEGLGFYSRLHGNMSKLRKRVLDVVAARDSERESTERCVCVCVCGGGGCAWVSVCVSVYAVRVKVKDYTPPPPSLPPGDALLIGQGPPVPSVRPCPHHHVLPRKQNLPATLSHPNNKRF